MTAQSPIAPGRNFVTNLYKLGTTPTSIITGSTIKPTVLSYVSFCNVTALEVLFDVYVTTGSGTFYLYKDYPIAKGTTFIMERDNPEFIRVKPTWEVFLKASTDNSLDATVGQIESEGNRVT